MKLPPFPTTAEIDARSQELLDEFDRHKEEVTEAIRGRHPDLIEPDEALHSVKMFIGWGTQKISGLQLLVEWQQEVITQLIDERRRKK